MTRDSILNMLRRRGPLSVNDLADVTGVTPVSVRHHLSALQAEGLITATESHSSVGRPKLMYSLTQAAVERFPTKYLRFTDRLLDELKTALPSLMIEKIFEAMAYDIASGHASRLEGKTLDEKLTLLAEILGEEGFMAEWNKVGEAYQLTEYNCPYFMIGQRHPEVCTIDQTLISKMLSRPVAKSTCLLNGDQRCVFVIGGAENTSIKG
ncbi:MAG: ArsR family transcriptional regulator [Chloroflexi bacterium]|nr:ArsR family transcriptional regulator [Chloroflexota bacterium]